MCLVAGAAQCHNHATNINIYKYYLYVSNVSDQLGCVTTWQMRDKHYDAIEIIKHFILLLSVLTFQPALQPTNHVYYTATTKANLH